MDWIAVIVLVPVLWHSGTRGVEVAVWPVEAVAVEGEPYRWHCQLDYGTNSPPQPPPSFSWQFNEDQIDQVTLEARRRILADGTLYFRSVVTSDVGSYSCIINSNNTSYYSPQAELRLAFLARTFTVHPVSQFQQVGSTFSLTCEINSLPPPHFSWLHNGQPTRHGMVTMVTLQQSMLTLTDSTYAQSGEYVCVATNQLLSRVATSNKAVVVLQGKPEFKVEPLPASGIVESSAIFHCEVIGSPVPILRWYDARLGAGQEVSIKSGSKYTLYFNGSMRIWNLETEDSGFYTCQGKNTWGTAAKTVLLSVYDDNTGIVFSLTPEDTAIRQGESVTWECSATANPAPRITWAKESGTLPAGRSHVPYSGALRINPVEAGDDGIYTCTAESAGQRLSHRIQLTVNVEPRLVSPPEDTTISEGSSLLLRCQAEGNPTPSISWRLPDNSLVNAPYRDIESGFTVLEEGDLQVTMATQEHAGSYTCIARNKVATESIMVNVYVKYGPVFIRRPEDTERAVGDMLTFNCLAQGHPQPTVTWYENEIQIVPNQAYQILANGSLHIASVQKWQDLYRYMCVAQNSANMITATAILTVLVPPSFIRQTSLLQLLNEGESVWLDCVADGKPRPSVSWHQQSGDPMLLDSNMIVYPNHTLHISNVLETQFRSYVCQASNSVGFSQLVYSVNKPDAPEFVTPPTNTTAGESSTVRIPCDATALDPPTVKWYLSNMYGYQGAPVLNSNRQRSPPITIESSGEMVIQEVEVDDEGWYLCVAGNSVGSLTAHAYLDVKVAPTIRELVSPVQVSSLETFELSCPNDADPEAEVSWVTPSGGRIPGEGHHLVVESADVGHHWGEWQCRACNYLGCDSAVFEVKVKGAPVITGVNGWFDEERTSDVLIHCKGHGTPLPKVTYFWGQLEISRVSPPAGHQVDTNNVLRIMDGAEREGHRCQLSNAEGMNEVNLTVPSPPTNLQTVSISNTSVMLIWTERKDFYPTPVWYTINYQRMTPGDQSKSLEQEFFSPSPDISTEQVTEDIFQPQYLVTGLTPFMAYKFYVDAMNAIGYTSSASLFLQMLEGRPEMPANMEGSYHAGVSKVTWEPPENMNGNPANLEYHLIYRNVATSSILESGIIQNNPPFSHSLSHLPYDTIVSVEITTVNTQVDMASAPAKVLIVVQEVPPSGKPQITVARVEGSRSLYISWKAIEDTSVAMGYAIAYAPLESSEVQIKRTDLSVTWYIFNDLERGRSYELKVAAYNMGGEGPYSEPVVVTMDDGDDVAASSGRVSNEILIAAIIGCLAAILLVILIVIVAWKLCRMKQRKDQEKEAQQIYEQNKSNFMHIRPHTPGADTLASSYKSSLRGRYDFLAATRGQVNPGADHPALSVTRDLPAQSPHLEGRRASQDLLHQRLTSTPDVMLVTRKLSTQSTTSYSSASSHQSELQEDSASHTSGNSVPLYMAQHTALAPPSGGMSADMYSSEAPLEIDEEMFRTKASGALYVPSHVEKPNPSTFSFKKKKNKLDQNKRVVISSPLGGTLQRLPAVGAEEAMQAHRQNNSTVMQVTRMDPDPPWMEPYNPSNIYQNPQSIQTKNQKIPPKNHQKGLYISAKQGGLRPCLKGMQNDLDRSKGSQGHQETTTLQRNNIAVLQDRGSVNPAFIQDDPTAVMF